MSEAKENEDVPLAVEETQHLVEALVQPEDSAVNRVENGIEAEAPAEDKNVKPEANSGCILQQDVLNSENTLHSVKENDQILNKIEGSNASDVKSDAEEVPLCDKGIKNDANVCQSNPDTAEVTAEVNLEVLEVTDDKVCNNGDSNSIHSSHDEPNILQAANADIQAEIKSGLENENKDNEMQAVVAHADNGDSISKNLYFLDPDYSYDGNESGTEEEQSAFMKELENFFRERSMEFKPPKFYKEGLNCLK